MFQTINTKPLGYGEVEHFLIHDVIRCKWDCLTKAWEDGFMASETRFQEVQNGYESQANKTNSR